MSNEVDDVFGDDDIAEFSVPDDNALETIARLVTRQVEAEDRVAMFERELSMAKLDLQNIQQKLLPDAFSAAGMESFATADGCKVEVKDFVEANITNGKPERKIMAFKWLRDNNHGSLIKNTVVTRFSKGEDERAAELMQHLKELGLAFQQEESVHGGTLKKWVKEEIFDHGRTFTSEEEALLGIHRFKSAKITRPDAQQPDPLEN